MTSGHHLHSIPSCVVITLAAILCSASEAGAQSRSSTNYTVESESLSSGVAEAESNSYSSMTSLGLPEPTGQSGGPYEATSEFSGQLAVPVGFAVAGPAEVNETRSAVFTPALGFDDGTYNPLASDPSDSFSIDPGSPYAAIDSDSGIVQTAAVFEDVWLTVNLQRGGVQVTRLFEIANTIADNFGSYALDGIDDAWQNFHFGMDNPNAAPNQDPESDGLNNLQEYLFRLHPNEESVLEVYPDRRVDGTLVYSYSRNAEAAAHGARFEAEWSDSMSPLSWRTAGVSEQILSDDGKVQWVEVNVDGSDATRRFVRVRATGIPEP